MFWCATSHSMQSCWMTFIHSFWRIKGQFLFLNEAIFRAHMLRWDFSGNPSPVMRFSDKECLKKQTCPDVLHMYLILIFQQLTPVIDFFLTSWKTQFSNSILLRPLIRSPWWVPLNVLSVSANVTWLVTTQTSKVTPLHFF